MKMSDKFISIYELVEVDNKDAIVREVRALKNFTEDELSSIFGNPSILWILENYTIKELKDKVRKVESNVNINLGDIVIFKQDDVRDVVGVVIEISGRMKDRCTILSFSNSSKFFRIQEGVSFFDIEVIRSGSSDNFVDVIKSLNNKGEASLVSEGGDL